MQPSVSVNSPLSTMSNGSILLDIMPPIPKQPIPKKSQQIRTDKPRPHVCTICTRAFARLEHLKRHERAHTNEKPYQCAACGRCFARRDLVLRHQQKLHTDLPHVIRRGSSKDGEINEHINVLHNNTNANAPLPDGTCPAAALDNEKPVFRTSLFENNPTAGLPHGPTGSIIIDDDANSMSNSPRPSITLHSSHHRDSVSFGPSNTPPTTASTVLGMPAQPTPTTTTAATANQIEAKQGSRSNSRVKLQHQQQQQPTPDSPQLKKFKPSASPMGNTSGIPSHLSNNYRHASYSAASGPCYSSFKEADFFGISGQVEFATPQFGPQNEDFGKLLESNGLLDWDSIDHLDLNDEGKLAMKQKSIKNLHDFFTDNLKVSSMNHSQSSDVRLHNDMNHKTITQSVPQQPQQQPPIKHSLASDITPTLIPGSQQEQQQQQQQQHLPPNSHLNSVSSKASINPQHLNQTKKAEEPNQNDWFRDLVFPPFDLNIPFSAHASSEDLKGFFGPTSLLADTNDNYRKQLNHQQQQQQMNGNYNHKPNVTAKSNGNEIPLALRTHINSVADFSVEYPTSFFLEDATLITEELRNKILAMSNIEDKDLPSLSDLKRYFQLYEYGFNKYFPFIHLPSLKNSKNHNLETVPLLLAIAAIGALYAYHDNDPLILFNLSKFHIQNFFEKEITLNNLHFKKVPIMAHQCLVLHIFISLFLNEPNMVDITSRQIKSMIGLIKSTNFNEPLEKLIIPPQPAIPGSAGDKSLIQKNFDYFIMAQSRIRTLHVFYFLQAFRSAFGGVPILFSFNMLKSGSFCTNEKLWWCEGSSRWYNLVGQTYPSKWSLIDVSNGAGIDVLVSFLNDPTNVNTPISYNNLLVLLFTIHERIIKAVDNVQPFTHLRWLEKKRPLQALIMNWEVLFHQNHGSSKIITSTRGSLSAKHELKLILPMLALVKMKLEVRLNFAVSSVLQRNWVAMNSDLDRLVYRERKYNVLTTSLPHCRDILELWMHNMETINYDVRETARRTPAFFCCTLFISVILIATYLSHIEKNCLEREITNQELECWFDCQELFSKLETVLSVSIRSSYLEDLTKDFRNKFSDETKVVKKLRELIFQRESCDDALSEGIDVENNQSKLVQINQEIKKGLTESKISMKSIYLGIRILADVPVWPLAMVFAEALKSRAKYIEK